MKTLLAIIAFGAALIGASSCADLGFGVDVDSGPYGNYWYPNGYLGDYYWNTPLWNYGPIYNPIPPAPPLIGNGPGSVGMPANRPNRPTRPSQPSQPSRPSQGNRPPTVNPGGPNGIGWNPGPMQRPGNNGLPSGRPIK